MADNEKAPEGKQQDITKFLIMTLASIVIMFIVFAGVDTAVNKGKDLMKVITKNGVHALALVGAIEIIKSAIGAIKDKKNKNQGTETKIIA